MSFRKFTKQYTQTPNEILNSETLSFKAKGVWTYLNSKPDGWNFSIKGAQKQSKDGYESISNGMKELEQHGYLKRCPKQNKEGKFIGYDYHLYDCPNTENTEHGKPDNGKHSNHSNTVISKTILSNKEKEKADLKKSLDSFLNKETIEIFNLWVDYRTEIKKSLKSNKTKISLAKKIKENGIEKSKKVINYSISNGYQGLFWDREENKKNAPAKNQTAAQALRERIYGTENN